MSSTRQVTSETSPRWSSIATTRRKSADEATRTRNARPIPLAAPVTATTGRRWRFEVGTRCSLYSDPAYGGERGGCGLLQLARGRAVTDFLCLVNEPKENPFAL